MKLGSALWLGAALSAILAAQTCAPAAATINISVTTPVYPNFSGLRADLEVPAEYWDYRFNTMSSTIVWCWVRVPGATASGHYEVLNGNRP
jgi:hypothetical protein